MGALCQSILSSDVRASLSRGGIPTAFRANDRGAVLAHSAVGVLDSFFDLRLSKSVNKGTHGTLRRKGKNCAQ